MNVLLGGATLAQRELVRFYRQRSRIVGSLAMPVIVWALLGSGLQAAFPSGMGQESREFLKYFFPGNLILTLVFTSIFSTISIIEDRHEGFLQSVLVSPLSPTGIVLGKVGGGAFIALFQGLLFLALAPLAGFHLNLLDILAVVITITSISLTMTALGFLFAWRLDSVQGFHAVMNLVLFPMWLLSGAFFPPESASRFLKPLMYLNPLTYGMWALKGALGGKIEWVSFMSLLGMVLLFGIVFMGSSVWLVHSKREMTA
ncbi:MAG: multidrug ABC transporter permease [Proteobacteria bacterium]|nr:multidrug ABC transporter permease [Pseudomonadota bacterium]NDC23269.1 multidrug ABC transporter permease [Pseudomonadota bacterium]NDD03487.1 multidrug ABC transporter permease [Pseudomonadota bacterium]NDG25874.1 multidrug ABC transporter permease [Pseudomonadota bacterium]